MTKPYTKLTRADLQQAPVWEWLSDESSDAGGEASDECFVQPTQFTAIPLLSIAQFTVAMTVGLQDGSFMPGIAEVTVAEGKISVQPTTAFLLDRHLQIPGVEANRLITRFTKTIENYPTSWMLNVPVEGETRKRSGKIRGGDMKNAVAAGIAVLMSLKALRR